MSIEQIRDILLDHKGKRNAIKSKEIAQQINIDRGPSNVTIRTKILETIKTYKIPVAGNPALGYFLITNKEELKEYQKSLQSRINKIIERSLIMERLYYRYYHDEELELGDEIFGPDENDDFEEEGDTLEI
jgi:biotin carboxylase